MMGYLQGCTQAFNNIMTKFQQENDDLIEQLHRDGEKKEWVFYKQGKEDGADGAGGAGSKRKRDKKMEKSLKENKSDIYIDLSKIIKRSDSDGIKAIHAHLLNITRLLVPEDMADEVLEKFKNKIKENKKVTKGINKLPAESLLGNSLDNSTKEGQLINNMVNSISTQLPSLADGNTQPSDMMSIVQQIAPTILGQFTGAAQNGDIDQNKLIDGLEGMVMNMFKSLRNANTSDTSPISDEVD